MTSSRTTWMTSAEAAPAARIRRTAKRPAFFMTGVAPVTGTRSFSTRIPTAHPHEISSFSVTVYQPGISASISRQIPRLGLIVEELGDVVPEDELEVADGAIALFGDDDLGDPFLFGWDVFVVDLVAVDEADHVRVLFD